MTERAPNTCSEENKALVINSRFPEVKLVTRNCATFIRVWGRDFTELTFQELAWTKKEVLAGILANVLNTIHTICNTSCSINTLKGAKKNGFPAFRINDNDFKNAEILLSRLWYTRYNVKPLKKFKQKISEMTVLLNTIANSKQTK